MCWRINNQRGYPGQLIKFLSPQALGFLEEFDLDEDKKLSFSEFKKAVASIKKKGAKGELEEQEDLERLETLDGLQEGEFKKAVEILKIIKNAVKGIKRKDVKKEVDLQEEKEEQKILECVKKREVQEELEWKE